MKRKKEQVGVKRVKCRLEIEMECEIFDEEFSLLVTGQPRFDAIGNALVNAGVPRARVLEAVRIALATSFATANTTYEDVGMKQ